jgi:uncharacterized phage protein (TIGR01671 family)
MREHKYRAWIPNIQAMIRHREVIERAHLLFEGSLNSSDIVMQYTGLQDKNGVEIYEGDILFNNQGVKFIVIYEFGTLKLQEITNQKIIFTSNFNGENNKQVEVIGNIYKHPKLLNK